MSCEHVRAVLSGEAPAVPVEAHLAACPDCRAFAEELAAVDAAARALPEIPPPEPLVAATWAAVEAEMAPPRRARRWAWAGAGLALAAAALLAVRAPDPAPADPGTLVPRGSGEDLPAIELQAAVASGGRAARLARGAAVRPGETVYFRVHLDRPAWVGLVRLDAGGARLVHAGPVAAGAGELAAEGRPLGWRVEPGEGDAVFAVIAAPSALSPQRVEDALSGAYDADDPRRACRAAASLGARCDAVAVKVAP